MGRNGKGKGHIGRSRVRAPNSREKICFNSSDEGVESINGKYQKVANTTEFGQRENKETGSDQWKNCQKVKSIR